MIRIAGRARPRGPFGALRRLIRGQTAVWILPLLIANPALAAPTAVPAVFQTAPGRFEIVAPDPVTAGRIVALAEEVWRTLAEPLRLPAAFASPVFVRVLPADGFVADERFRVLVEPGGVVSVRISASADMTQIVPQALVQGLLWKLAVGAHGANDRIAVPRWLEHAAVERWRTRAQPAQIDALKRESEKLVPPRLAELLAWSRDAEEARPLVVGAFWLLEWLQAESPSRDAWGDLLMRLLAGEEPLRALAARFPARLSNADEGELWWQTGWHHLRRTPTLATAGVAESQSTLERLSRFVFEREGRDVVLPLREALEAADEPFVAAELAQRATELARTVPALHPFFRNAGLSLAEAFRARAANEPTRHTACAAFERDWQEGLELAAAAKEALDRLEAEAVVHMR